MQTFEHGGKVFAAARDLGLELSEIIDFSANINPFVSEDKLKQWSAEIWPKIRHYPDPDYYQTRSLLAQYHGVGYEQVLLGNGAASLIDLLVRAIAPRTALVTAPCFAEYRRALSRNQSAYQELAVDDNLELNLEQFFQQAKQVELAFLTNPNNPTGKLLDKAELLDNLIKAGERTKTLFVIDEAFIDFSDKGEDNSLISDIAQLANTIVLRSLTKFYGIPALRLGYVISSNDGVLQALKDLQVIWDINLMATEIAEKALLDTDFYHSSRQGVRQLKAEFQSELKQLGYQTIISQANYFLLKTNQKNIYSKLYQNGIIIRDCQNFSGLNEAYYRLAVRTKGENQSLINALQEIKKR